MPLAMLQDQLIALALCLEFGNHLFSKPADSSTEPSDATFTDVCPDGGHLLIITPPHPIPPGILGHVCVPQGPGDRFKLVTEAKKEH